MPEIKHNFIKGRMNKDLDERLVADGEYRDALNIQVVTSSGSDAGTVQNIKGNTLKSVTNDMYCGSSGSCGEIALSALGYDTDGCVTVGTVANPTKNTILWLQHLNHKAYSLGAQLWQVLEFDRILEYDTLTGNVTPVLVDNYRTTTYNRLAAKDATLGMVLNPGTLGLQTRGIRVGMEVKCWNANGDNVWATSGSGHYIHEDVVVTVVGVVANTSITLSRSNHATVAGTAYTEDTNPDVITFDLQSKLTFEEDRVLNLDNNRLVTGINIVDDMLFFTDNETEPKKVHIERSKLGTSDLLSHTKVYANGILYDGSAGNKLEYIKEKHITVIKKSPLFPPTLEISNTLRGGGSSIINTVAPNYPIFSNAAITGFSGACSSFNGSYNLQEDGFMFDNSSAPAGLYFIDDDVNTPNPTTTILVPNGGGDVNWLPLDRIILKATSVSQGIANIHEVHAIVLSAPVSYDNTATTAKTCYAYQNGYSSVNIEFTSIPTDIPTNYDEIISWDVTLNQDKESIFRFKFPKFSYRWKYEDGEYSCFSPFTEAAFVPSKFDYMPRKGFNLGMTNDIRMLKLSDFVNMETPDDVIEIDILYKESNSPNIYTVKTLKKERGAGINGTPTPADVEWTSDLLSIESDLIYASVPSNQLLRPWDNVPRKALAQDVTANRLVFANYLQNYDLIRETGEVVNPNISMSISDVIYNNPDLPKFSIDSTPDAKMPERSIKSLRTYQIGIVYKDVYGRETPVLTNYNPASSVMSIYLDKIRAQKYNQIIVGKSNLISNLEHPEWADSFKFFVKETSNEYYNLAMDRWYQAEDGNVWLSFPSSDRNKVDEETFIILKKQHDNDNPVEDRARYKILAIEDVAPEFITKKNFTFGDVVIAFSATGLPLTDSKFIDINTLAFMGTSLGGTIFPEKEKNLKLRLSTATNKSFFYKISDMTEIGSIVRITAEKAFDSDMDFTSDGSSGVVGGLSLEIVQERKEPTKEFQGRFFAKIHRDADLETNILQQSTTQDFVVVDTLRFAALNVGELDASGGIYGYDVPSGGTISANSQKPWNFLQAAKFSSTADWGHKEYLDPMDVQLVKQFWNSDRGGVLANTNALQYNIPAPSASGATGTGYVSGDAWARFSWFIDSQWGENPIKNGISHVASKTYGYGEELKVSEILAADGGGSQLNFQMGHIIQGGNTADLMSTGYLSNLFSQFDFEYIDGNGTGLDATSWLPAFNDKVGQAHFENNGFGAPVDNNVYKLGVSRLITPTSSGVSGVWLNLDRNFEPNVWTGFTNPHLKPAPGGFPFPNQDGDNPHIFNDIDLLQYRFTNPTGGGPAIDANSYYLQGDYETVDKDLYVAANGFNAHKFTAQHDGTIVQMNAQFQVRPALDCDSDHPTDPYGEIQFAVNNLFPQGAGQVALAGRTYGDTNLGVSGSIGSFKELVINVPDALPGQNNIGQPILNHSKLFGTGGYWAPQSFPHTKTTGGECPGCMHTGNFRGEFPDSIAGLNGGQPAGGLTGINVRLKLYHNNTTFSENVASGHVLADESTGFVPEQMGNALSFTSLEELDSPSYVTTSTPGSVMSRGDHFFAKNDTRLQLILAVDHQTLGNRIKLNAGESVWLELESYEKEFNYEHHISEQNFSAWYNAMHEGSINAHPSLVFDLGVNPGNVEAGSGLVWDGPDFVFGDAPDIGTDDGSFTYPIRKQQYALANAHYKFRGNYGGPIEIVEGSELDCRLDQDFTHDLITSQMEANVNLVVSDGNELGKIKRPIWGDAMHPWDDGSYYFGTPKFANSGATSTYTYGSTPTAFWHDTFLTKDRVGRLFGGVALPTGFNTNKNDIVDTSVSWTNLCVSVTNNAGCEEKTIGSHIVYAPTYHPADTWRFQSAYWHYIFGSLPVGGMMTALEQKVAGWYGGGCEDADCQKAHNKINEASPLNRIPDSFLTSLALNQWAGDSHATGVVDGVGNTATSDGDYSVSGGARVYSRRKNHYNPFAFGKGDNIDDWGLLNHKHSLLFGVNGRLGSHSGIATAKIKLSNLNHIIQAVSSGNYINYSFQWDPADKAYNYGYPLLFPFHKENNGATYNYDASTAAIGNIGNWNTSATDHDNIPGWVGTRIGESAASLCNYCNHTYSPRIDSNFTLLKGHNLFGNVHSGLVHDMVTRFNLATPAMIQLRGEPGLGDELDATFAGSQIIEFWDGGLNIVGSIFQPQTIVSSVGASYACGAELCYNLNLSKPLNTTVSWVAGAFVSLANGGNSNTANGSNPRVSLINSSANTDVLLHPTPWSDDLRDIYYAPSTSGLIVNAGSWYNDTYHSISSAIPSVASARDFSGYGLHDEGKKLHLSFGGINNEVENWKKLAYNLNVWHPELSTNLNNLKAAGGYFRFREDPNGCIFKINSSINSYDQNTNGIGIRNYMPAFSNPSGEEWDHPGFNGTHLVDDVKDPYNKRVRFYLEVEYTGWNRNSSTDLYEQNQDALTTHMGIGHRNNVSGSPGIFPELTYNPVLGTASDPVSSNLMGSNPSVQGHLYNTLEFVSPDWDGSEDFTTTNPAIWETEPKEDLDLDVYHEASPSYPIDLNKHNVENYFKVGSVVTSPNSSITAFMVLTNIAMVNGDIELTIDTNGTSFSNTTINYASNKILRFTIQDGSYVEGVVKRYYYDNSNSWIGVVTVETSSPLDKESSFGLPYFNCFSFGNGVESDRIRDDFNAVTMGKGVKVSTTIGEQYKEERRKSGFIFSGIYNSNSGINQLNQFISVDEITKELNPIYGSIQKLHARDTDIITFCEDKVLKVLANKDALFNADGNFQLLSSNNVLGQAVPYDGEYGISTNPESFSNYGYRSYFVDQKKGCVLRLSKNGIELLSDYGMSGWFRDNLDANNHGIGRIVGTYDPHGNNYDVTIHRNTSNKTISFNEKTNSWVSFKSYIQDLGIGLNGKYYTFKQGEIWEHYSNSSRNNFYKSFSTQNQLHYNSTIEFIFNQAPDMVKSFNSINYEGSAARITQNAPTSVQEKLDGVSYSSHDGSKPPSGVGEYFNNSSLSGWYVNLITTNLQSGRTIEFKDKEGKYYAPIKGEQTIWDVNSKPGNVDTSELSVQGIGNAMTIEDLNSPTGAPQDYVLSISADCWGGIIFGCTDPTAGNYDPLAVAEYPVSTCCSDLGCMNPVASNYDPIACAEDPNSPYYNTTTLTSCTGLIYGCTDNPATSSNILYKQSLIAPFQTFDIFGFGGANYNPLANMDDGSCAYYSGCSDYTAFNYNVNVTHENCSCIAIIYGCTDPLGLNYYPGANLDDPNNPCCYVVGCTDPTANNYDALACIDNGSCTYNSGCMDATALNYDPAAVVSGGNCCFTEGCNDDTGGSWINFMGKCRDGVDPGTSIAQCDYPCVIGNTTYSKCGWEKYGTFKPGAAACQSTQTLNNPGNGYTTAYDIDYRVYDVNGVLVSTQTQTGIKDYAGFTAIPVNTHDWCGVNIAEGCRDLTPGDNQDVNGYCSDGTTFVGIGVGGCVGTGYYWGSVDIPAWCSDPDSTLYPYGNGTDQPLPSGVGSNYSIKAFTSANAQCPGHNVGDCSLPGCTDPAYANYNAAATVDDGSCSNIAFCPATVPFHYPEATNADGSFLTAGYMDPSGSYTSAPTFTYSGATAATVKIKTYTNDKQMEKLFDGIAATSGVLANPGSVASTTVMDDGSCTVCLKNGWAVPNAPTLQMQYCEDFDYTDPNGLIHATNYWTSLDIAKYTCQNYRDTTLNVPYNGLPFPYPRTNQIHVSWPYRASNFGIPSLNKTRFGFFNPSFDALQDLIRLEYLNLDGQAVNEITGLRNNIHLKELNLMQNQLGYDANKYISNAQVLAGLEFATNLQKLNISNIIPWSMTNGFALRDNNDNPTFEGDYYNQSAAYNRGGDWNGGFQGEINIGGIACGINKVSLLALYNVLNTPGTGYGYTNPIYPSITEEYVSHLEYLDISNQAWQQLWEQYDSTQTSSIVAGIGSSSPVLIDTQSLKFNLRLPYDDATNKPYSAVLQEFHAQSSPIPSVHFNNGFNQGYYPTVDNNGQNTVNASDIENLSYDWARQAALKVMDVRYSQNFAHINLPYNHDLERLYVGRGNFHYGDGGGTGTMMYFGDPTILPTPNMLSTELGIIIDNNAADDALITDFAGSTNPIPFDFNVSTENLTTLVIEGEKVGGSSNQYSQSYKGDGETGTDCHNCGNCTDTLLPTSFVGTALQSINGCGNPLEIISAMELTDVDITVWTNAAVGHDLPSDQNQEVRGKSHIYFGRPNVELHGGDHPNMKYTTHFYDRNNTSGAYGRPGNTGINTSHSDAGVDINLQSEIYDLDPVALKSSGIVPGGWVSYISHDGTAVTPGNSNFTAYSQYLGSTIENVARVVSVNETSIKLSQPLKNQAVLESASYPYHTTTSHTVTTHPLSAGKIFANVPNQDGLRIWISQAVGSVVDTSKINRFSVGGVNGENVYPSHIIGNLPGLNVDAAKPHAMAIGQRQVPSDIVLHLGSQGTVDGFCFASGTTVDSEGRVLTGPTNQKYDFKGYNGGTVSWTTPNNESISYTVDVFLVP